MKNTFLVHNPRCRKSREALNYLKRIDKDHLMQIASKYMTGGGFGDITKMTKPQIIKPTNPA